MITPISVLQPFFYVLGSNATNQLVLEKMQQLEERIWKVLSFVFTSSYRYSMCYHYIIFTLSYFIPSLHYLYANDRPGHEIVGPVHVKQVYEIALMKLRDPHLSHLSHESLAKSIAASALSMGLKVVRD